MWGRLAGKIAVVTAAGQGIGRAVAEMFRDEGATVHASDLDPEMLAGLTGCDCRRLDITATDAVEAYAAAIGGIDVLVNVAGLVHHGSILTTTEADLARVLDLNTLGMHRTMHAFLPAMLERHRPPGATGSIVNMASCASSLKAIENRYAYGTSKAAVIGMTKSVALDLVARGIRCNAICPGPVRTPSWTERVEGFAKEFGDVDRALDVYLKKQPSGRVGEAHEVAALAVYLASDESAFMTGVALPLDGGLTL